MPDSGAGAHHLHVPGFGSAFVTETVLVRYRALTDIGDDFQVLADVHMPAMTGVELHRHLVKVGYPIPTILVTGYPNDVDRARALNDGVVCYLRKPVDEKNLIRCLRAALTPGEAPEGDS